MVRLPRPEMIRMSRMPARTASSTTYWMAGLSATGSISFGCALVAGRNRVPRPAAGVTAFVPGTRALLRTSLFGRKVHVDADLVGTDDTVATARFCLVHRTVGGAHQHLRCETVVGIH